MVILPVARSGRSQAADIANLPELVSYEVRLKALCS